MNLQIPDGDFDAYIFDCDGTLADTMPLHYEAWCMTMENFKCAFPEPLFYSLGGVPTAEIIKLLNQRQGLNMPIEATVKRKEAFYIQLIPKAKPIQPVVDFALDLHARKKPIAVASGGHRPIIRRTLTALGIAEHFDIIVGAEDYTRGKPAPDPYLVAASKLGVLPTRCLAFEDTALGIQSAASAGMATVQVPTPSR